MEYKYVNVLQIVAAPSKNNKNKLSVNGPERRSLSLLPYWSSKFVKPYVLYPRRGRLWENFRSSNVDVEDFEIDNKWSWHKAFYLRKVIQKNRIEVIHTQGPGSLDFIAAITSIIARVPLVVTRPVIISDMFEAKSLRAIMYNFFDRFTVKVAFRVIAVSNDGAERLKSECRVPNGKICIIRNGARLEKFKNIKRPIAKASNIAIGMIAQLTNQKRWDDFLRTIKEVSDCGISVKGIIVGDGPIREKLAERVCQLGLGDRITICGFCEDIEHKLSQMDIFLFASNWEGLPMAIVEAMASGLPIVATDIAGVRELVQHGINGYLCSVGDINALVGACVQLIRDDALRARMGSASKRIAEEQFSESVMLGKYSAVYHQCKGRLG
jgi:glycosyltransferase involved in cell wall biosynthesis